MLQVEEEAWGVTSLSPPKACGKGVPSVRSRVTNLCSHAPGLTAQRMRELLAQAAAEQYAPRDKAPAAGSPGPGRNRAFAKKYASGQWLYGPHLPFTHRLEQRWAWGGVTLELAVEHDLVQAAVLSTDAAERLVFGRGPRPGRAALPPGALVRRAGQTPGLPGRGPKRFAAICRQLWHGGG